ncbi:MAG: hypothetical protein AAF721_09300 [Myxococcota bacterium]
MNVRRSLAAVAALWVAQASPAAAAPEPSSAGQPVETAEDAFAAGGAAYEAGDYERAAEHYERGYSLSPNPVFLYSWAQAVRNAGDCTRAIELYERFLETGATGDSKAAAEQNIARCREAVPEPAVTDPEPTPQAPAPGNEPPPNRPADTIEDPSTRRRPDALGLGLLVPGLAAVAAGAVVLGVASVRKTTQGRSDQYERFDALDETIDRLHVAGGVTLGIGAALVVGGAVRLALQGRRAPKRVSLTANGLGIGLRVRLR